MTDFRALCAELHAAFTTYAVDECHHNLLERARVALADEPAVPEGREPASITEQPSDEELRDIWDSGHLPSNEELANDNGEQDLQFLFTSAYYQWLEENPDAMTEHKTKCIRAVFNAGRRWGTPNLAETRSSLGNAPQPVPVSERLPGPDDCDAEGRCWWWHPSHPESGYLEGWMLRPRAWGIGYYDLDDRLTHTHWLPAHALPLPTAND